MTKQNKPAAPAKKTLPSYMKEAFNMVQPGKSNHVSAKALMGAKRSKYGR